MAMQRAAEVSIFLGTWNHAVILPKVWAFYKTQFPDATIYIMDDHSQDKTVEVARLLGINVITVGAKTEGKVVFPARNYSQNNVHNYIWKKYARPGTWVITHDVDELLCMTQEQLNYEDKLGHTIIKTHGYDCIADSNRTDLSDLDLWSLSRGREWGMFDKRVIFKAGPSPLGLDDISFNQGNHFAAPRGKVHWSLRKYALYHAGVLGQAAQVEKFQRYQKRFEYKKLENVRYSPPLYYLTVPTVGSMVEWYLDKKNVSKGLPPLADCMAKGRYQVDPSLVVPGTQLSPLALKLRDIMGPASPPAVWPPPPPLAPRRLWVDVKGGPRCCLKRWTWLSG